MGSGAGPADALVPSLLCGLGQCAMELRRNGMLQRFTAPHSMGHSAIPTSGANSSLPRLFRVFLRSAER